VAYFILEDFRLGQDSRKDPLVSPPGTLTTLKNAHITPGGDLEKRKAFVAEYTLPTGTFGLSVQNSTLYAFGSAAEPAGMPSGVTYQRLQHPTGEAMTAVTKAEIFDGKLYVIARFADDSIYHFYDGSQVDFLDGSARGGLTVTGGTAGGVQATGGFTVTGGTSSPGVNKLSSVTVNGVEILGAAVDWATSHDATATAIAAQITSYASSPEYTASAVGAVVTITRTATGTGPNGWVVVPTGAGDVTTGSVSNMSGGSAPAELTSLKVNGVEILGSAIAWATSHSNTASLIAAQINTYVSSPEYTAVAAGDRVNIAAAASAGSTPNGYPVLATNAGTFTSTTDDMADGIDAADISPAGLDALTFDTKMYSTTGSRLVFSAINAPADYNDETGIGAGFINMANHSSGSEELTALEIFYDKLAVFAKEAVQIWFVEADDANNVKAQVIRNSGTSSPRSVIPFGDGDVFYLARNGVRALRNTGVNNIAQVVEVGSPIDPAILTYFESLTTAEKENATAVVEPINKRYWLAIGDRIYVYSFFSGAKIAAWSTYEVGVDITDFAVIGEQLYARSGDTIYLYGGEDGTTYDDCPVEVVVPYMDAKTPGNRKHLLGIDMVMQGLWTVQLALNPKAPEAFDDIGMYDGTTLHEEGNPALGESTYFAFKFTHNREEYARFSRFVMYFDKDEAKSG
jgi:hypothetical protein